MTQRSLQVRLEPVPAPPWRERLKTNPGDFADHVRGDGRRHYPDRPGRGAIRMRVVAFIARLISHQIQKHESQRCEGRQRPALGAGNWRREKNYSIISAISRSIASRCAT
jgi:hypothetical protein